MHFITLFNGRRYEGVPGQSDFRIIEFREHGIPIATPGDTSGGTQDPDTKPTRELWVPSDRRTSRSCNSAPRVPSWRWY